MVDLKRLSSEMLYEQTKFSIISEILYEQTKFSNISGQELITRESLTTLLGNLAVI